MFGGGAAAQVRQQRGANIVGARNAEIAPLLFRLEDDWYHQAFYFGKELFKFLENLAPSQRELKSRRRANHQLVLKHGTRALKGAADSRLTEQKPGGGFGGAFFLRDHRKDDQEVQIDLSQFL